VKASIAQIVTCTEAEGPGRRFAVWFQGCPFRCPGCCNPEMLNFDASISRPLAAVIQDMQSAVVQHAIEGISLLGGEPFAHVEPSTVLAKTALDLGLSVMVYTGFTLTELRLKPENAELLSLIDVLVDGPYVREQPEQQRRWVGSANQQVHFLTDRYRADDPCWTQRNTIEIRLRNRELSVNGFPTRSAVDFWQRLPRRREVVNG
jgi:anaerobic ribonucleoside-triphosphate reductase activating protein